jgi:hypothetical protein
MLGREAGVRTRMFMLALALAASARAAEAQRVEVAMPHLRYVAPASCPDRSFFIERMRARLDAAGAHAVTDLSLRVTLETRGSVAHGSLQVERGGPSAPRTLEAGNCREVVEGLALIAALAIAAPDNPRSRASTGANRSPVNRSGGSAKSGAGSRAQPAAADTQANAAQAPPVAAEQHASEARAARAEPTATDARAERGNTEVAAIDEVAPRELVREPAESNDDAAVDAEDSEDDTPSRRPRAGDPRLRGWGIGAGVLAIHGVGPSVQPGLQLLAAVTLDFGALDWTLRLGGRLALEHTETSPQGSAHFGLIAGVLQLCATGALGGSALTLDGCAVAEPGALLASADHTENPQRHTRPWFAAGAGTGFGWRAARWLSIRAGGEVLAPLRRDRMLLAGDELHRVSPVCLRVELSLEVPLG